MAEVIQLARDVVTKQSSTPTNAPLDALAETEADGESGAIEMLRISSDANLAGPHGAHSGKTPCEALGEKL